MDLLGHSVEIFWTPRGSHQRLQQPICVQVHQRPLLATGDKDQPIDSLQPTNRWPDRVYWPSSGHLDLVIVAELTQGQLVYPVILTVIDKQL